jgi:hypothetical protein
MLTTKPSLSRNLLPFFRNEGKGNKGRPIQYIHNEVNIVLGMSEMVGTISIDTTKTFEIYMTNTAVHL